MSSSYVVFYKILTTCLLIFVGYIARRMKILPEISVSILSKYLMYLCLPCYFLFHMPSSISLETLHQYWFYPILGFVLMGLGDVASYIVARVFARPGELATFRLICAVPNWIFMALAVCVPLFHEDGLRVVLLYNMGINFYVWTFALTSFRSGVGAKEILKKLFVNIQTIGLAIGFLLALFVPMVRGMEKLTADELVALPLHIGILTPIWETVYLIGSTALPISILNIGLLLGTPAPEGERPDGRSLGLTIVFRLLLAPVLTLGAMVVAQLLGVGMNKGEFVTSVIIMGMPAGVLCLSIVEVYGGANRLTAKCVLWGTIASLFTAPVVTGLAEWVYGML